MTDDQDTDKAIEEAIKSAQEQPDSEDNPSQLPTAVNPLDKGVKTHLDASAEDISEVVDRPYEIEPPQKTEDLPPDQKVGQDSQQDIRDRLLSDFRGDYDFGRVEVSPSERMDFIRSGLNDSELVFRNHVSGVGIEVIVAIPSGDTTSSILWAIHEWGKKGWIDADDDMQFIPLFTQMHVWYQIREIAGKATGWMDPEEIKTSTQLREKLAKRETLQEVMDMSGPRWQITLLGLRVAEHKYKICLSRLLDRSFFETAESA